jgi:SAM-dependent methyltransferase
VVEVNRIFHAIEARMYDDRHPEIHEQLPDQWRELVSHLDINENTRWSMLDFGAGTGFATSQIIAAMPKQVLQRVICVDLSPQMLEHCKNRVTPLMPHVECRESLPEIGDINLLLTNSVLHHLPDVGAQIEKIEPLLAPGAWWILGHEPSCRFHRNPELQEHLFAYLEENRWRRYLRPSRYLGFINRLFKGDPRELAARESVAAGLFRLQPDPDTIDRLVDFGVAHSLEEVEAGRGLDLAELEKQFAGRWKLITTSSYGFMGKFFEGTLPSKWQKRCQQLAIKYPEDGGNFCAIWKRL